VSLSGTVVVFVRSFGNGDNRNPLRECRGDNRNPSRECSGDIPDGMQVRKGVTESSQEAYRR